MPRKRKTAAHEDTQCAQAIAALQAHFAAATANGEPVFTTDVKGLFNLFLASLSADQRQQYTCSACRKFIETYGSLVVIDDDGDLEAAVWPIAEPAVAYAFDALWMAVESARITGVFLSKDYTWGLPSNLDKHNHVWEHFAVQAPEHLVWSGKTLTAGQRRAELRENYLNVVRALADVPAKALDQALRVFEGEHVSRAEHFVGPVKWLRALHGVNSNLIWKAVATAPNGYCHPRSSVVWPLLEGILEGKSFDTIKRQFEVMVAPLQYQRPQAPPSAGTVKQAEELFEKLGLASALERRFARLSDVQEFTWRPRQREDADNRVVTSKGIFAHLETKDAKHAVPALDLPAIAKSWAKFKRDVLPTTAKLQVRVPLRGGFYAFTAACTAAAPPVLKWDREDLRNTVAWYTYPGGSPASQWGLPPCKWVEVTAVLPFPTEWGGEPKPYLGDGELLVLEGCVDSQTGMGNALFPEILRGDLYGVRSVIEAYSRKAELQGRAEAEVCGLGVRTGACSLMLRAWVNGQAQDYTISQLD